MLTVELVASRVTFSGDSPGIDENVFTVISWDESPMPFSLNGTT